MSYNAALYTAERIIATALVDAGKLAEGVAPNSRQLADGLNRLNDLTALWQTQGLKLFLWQDLSVTLTQGVAQYTLGPAGTVPMDKPTRTWQAYWKDAQTPGNRRPLVQLSWDEWMRLSQTAQQGTISQFFVDKQAQTLTVNVWPTPDAYTASGTLHLLIQRQAAPMTLLNSATMFPAEWYLALRWGLADEWCTGQPDQIVARCKERAMTFRQALEAWDVEDADTRLEVDTSRGYSARGFV